MMTTVPHAASMPKIEHPGEPELIELLQSFTETAERLQSTHDVLNAQVVRLESELAEANEQLRRSRELAALGEMAAGIAHEIRNPLASIQLFAEVLKEDLDDRPEQRDVCRKIEVSVTRMDTIVRDVLRFARDATVRFETVSSSTLVHAVVDACSSQIQEAALDPRIDVGNDPSVDVDLSLMTQAIGNILRNAYEITIASDGDCAPIDVTVAEQRVRCPDGVVHDRVVISIADRGAGIDDDAMSKLFNPFFTTRDGGTGLGLAIAHRVVDAHDGHIAVSQRSGGGTRFDVCLPPVVVDMAPTTESSP